MSFTIRYTHPINGTIHTEQVPHASAALEAEDGLLANGYGVLSIEKD